jgi:hypothetical protein
MRAAFALCAVQGYLYDRLPAHVAAVRLHQPPLAAVRRLWGAGAGVLAAVVDDPVTAERSVGVLIYYDESIPCFLC